MDTKMKSYLSYIKESNKSIKEELNVIDTSETSEQIEYMKKYKKISSDIELKFNQVITLVNNNQMEQAEKIRDKVKYLKGISEYYYIMSTYTDKSERNNLINNIKLKRKSDKPFMRGFSSVAE